MRLGSWAVAANEISIQPGTSGILKQQDPDLLWATSADLCSSSQVVLEDKLLP